MEKAEHGGAALRPKVGAAYGALYRCPGAVLRAARPRGCCCAALNRGALRQKRNTLHALSWKERRACVCGGMREENPGAPVWQDPRIDELAREKFPGILSGL